MSGTRKPRSRSGGTKRRTPARGSVASARRHASGKRPARRAVAKVPRRTRQSSASAVPLWLRASGAIAIRVGVVTFVGVSAAVVGLFVYGRDLPSVDNLADARKSPRVTVADRYGITLGIHGKDRGDPVDAATLPPHVLQAFLATEDRTFFHHVGVNPLAILRAVMVNLHEGEMAQGGSTITQQLVKNLLLTSEKTIDRKVREMLLALRIEAQYSKEEILELYLNAVYFGNNAYGLEAAARRYFGKAPQELSIGEAAMLAGLLKAPSRFSPARDQETARGRASVVLDLMVYAGYITRSQAQAIVAGGIATIIPDDFRAGYAVQYAVEEAERLIGSFDQDATIYTTIDSSALFSTVAARSDIAAKDADYVEGIQTAALTMEADGAIRVLIGGNDFSQNQFNRATKARRQPGSVFKPFVYLAALEQGYRPEDVIPDQPIKIGDYEPKNYKGVYAEYASLTEAMSRSLNAAVIGLQEEIGRDIVVDVARRAGLSGVVDIGPALALGVIEATPLEVASAYLTFSNRGAHATPYIVARIETPSGNMLYRHGAEPLAAPVFDRETLVAFDHMLRAVITSGSGRNARLRGHYAAGKTGTSQDSRDAWFAGYASGVVGVVWLGKDDFSPMDNGHTYVSGSGAPSRLWSEMMLATLGDRPAIAPIPYRPRPTVAPMTMMDHLRAILGREDTDLQQERAPSTDELTQVLTEVAL